MSQVIPKENLSLDSTQENVFITFFKTLSSKPSTTICFFDRGEYYSVHGEDAILTAKEFFHTNSVIKYFGSNENQLEYVVLSKLNFESFIRILLLVKQYRIEVYKQKTNSKNDWQCLHKASPGNLLQFEEVLFGSNASLQHANPGVLSLKTTSQNGKLIIGAALVDVNSQNFMIAQFEDSNSFSNIESLIVHLGCKECLVPASEKNPDFLKLEKILQRNKLLISEQKKADYNVENASQVIGNLLKHKEGSNLLNTHLQMNSPNAISALKAAIKYLQLVDDEANQEQFSLKTFEIGSFVHLDGAALQALHLESASSEMSPKDKSETTLFGLLDKCQTPQGKRLLAQWIRQPLIDPMKIAERQDLVECLVSSVELRHTLGEDHLKRIPDLHRLARKLSRKAATLQDCYRLYQCVEHLPNLCETLMDYTGKHSTTLSAVFLTPIQEHYADMSKFQEMLRTTLDMDLANRGEFVVKAEFEEVLEELQEKMRSIESELQKEFRKAAADLNLEATKSIKMETNSQMGYHFRVTLKEEKILRNNRSYIILDSNKAGVRFRNGALQDLNAEHSSAREEYHEQQKSIAGQIISIASGYADVALNIGNLLSVMDCIYAFAAVASSAPLPYCRPEILPKGSGIIELTECRHPCIEQMNGISFIPNDCYLNKDSGIFHIITGPNMGGKSTFLRSVATTVLLAQVGAYIPCKSGRISVVDSILTRVGAGDCQVRGISTFMIEMLETSLILKNATKDSLVIIDELGRGTSTYDGFGLAWAISETISKDIKPFCLFATHFQELTALEREVSTVKNYHVAASTIDGNLTLLYQVKRGPCDRSFGIQVAKLANFPKDVIEFAKSKAKELEDDYDMDDDQSEEAFKRRKEEKKRGVEIIEEFLGKAKSLDSDSLTDSDLESKIKEMREEIQSHKNQWIEHLVSTAS